AAAYVALLVAGVGARLLAPMRAGLDGPAMDLVELLVEFDKTKTSTLTPVELFDDAAFHPLAPPSVRALAAGVHLGDLAMRGPVALPDLAVPDSVALRSVEILVAGLLLTGMMFSALQTSLAGGVGLLMLDCRVLVDPVALRGFAAVPDAIARTGTALSALDRAAMRMLAALSSIALLGVEVLVANVLL
ncbi:unnamed protein product, partial [Prorocentrum cordatum]